MAPNGGGEPHGDLRRKLVASFGTLDDFKATFTNSCLTHFGSGWVWLVVDADNLAVVQTHDAGNPICTGMKPLLVNDVWEHAYYIDYRHERLKFVEAWWKLVNWEFAAANLRKAST